MCFVETRRALGRGTTASDGYVMIALKGEMLMKYSRRSEKLDRYLRKQVKITLKNDTTMTGRLIWLTNSLVQKTEVIRAFHYYLITKDGPVRIPKCSVKHIEEYFEVV